MRVPAFQVLERHRLDQRRLARTGFPNDVDIVVVAVHEASPAGAIEGASMMTVLVLVDVSPDWSVAT
jgi:hypothetical protein